MNTVEPLAEPLSMRQVLDELVEQHKSLTRIMEDTMNILVAAKTLMDYETENPLLYVADVARITGVSEATLRFWRLSRNKGELEGPRSQKVDGRVVYRSSDVKDWLEEQFKNGYMTQWGSRA